MPASRRRQQEIVRERERREAAARAGEATARRRRVVIGVVLALGLFATVVAVVAATSEADLETADSTTSTSATTTGPAGPTPVVVPLPAPGATVVGAVDCPPAEGSPERVTSFDEAPPQCLPTTADGAVDPSVTVKAIVHTSAGDLTYLLDTERAPEAVNSFVVLARYGYFDDAPLDVILRSGWAEVGGAFDDGTTAGDAMGWTLPTEAPEVGTIQVPGTLSIAPTPGSDGLVGQGGRYLIALGDQAADLPARTTTFGLLLDGTDAFPRIIRAGTESGQPGEVIVIEGIDVVEEPEAP